jgi:hypothetical protein
LVARQDPPAGRWCATVELATMVAIGIKPEATMNWMTLQLPKPRAMRLRAHDLALVEPDGVISAAPTCDDEFSRCGWFDSSLELREGLQVVEFIDHLPPDLPLELA